MGRVGHSHEDGQVTERETYDEPPACRWDGCKSFPCWEAETDGETEDEPYCDYLCGRHLPTFMWMYIGYKGWIKLTRRDPREHRASQA